MRSFLVLAVLLPAALATGCKKYTYIEQLDGDWTGTATSGAASLPTTATFSWDDEKEVFGGTVDFDGYYYLVNGASSDKESAELILYSDGDLIGPGKITALELNEEGDEFDSKFTINICPGGEGDPALCEVPGTLNMKMN
jgi:hypothetical protein